MANASPKVAEILDATEKFVRTQGYHGFSFRDVAAEVGIKSASVHYHFPTKADLGAAVARRYTDRFLEQLGAPDAAPSPAALLDRYAAAYRRALVEDGQMCLCGILGAEIGSVPAPVAAEAKRFFEQNLQWLARVLSRAATDDGTDPPDARRRAMTFLATLEGALIVARALQRTEAFDQIVAGIAAAVATDRDHRPSA